MGISLTVCPQLGILNASGSIDVFTPPLNSYSNSNGVLMISKTWQRLVSQWQSTLFPTNRRRPAAQRRAGDASDLSAVVETCESRVLLTSVLPADIEQMIQNSQHPAAWYAALNIILPAIEQAVLDEEAAYSRYNSSLDSISTTYDSGMTTLGFNLQNDLQTANDNYWTAVNAAEDGLTATYNSSSTVYHDTVNPASIAYHAQLDLLWNTFNNEWMDLYYSGGSEKPLWSNLLTGEIAA